MYNEGTFTWPSEKAPIRTPKNDIKTSPIVIVRAMVSLAPYQNASPYVANIIKNKNPKDTPVTAPFFIPTARASDKL